MGHALAEAALAPAHDDVPVGAVVIDETGEIIGRGHNRREVDSDPLGHAELMAISAAASAKGQWRLDGCTLVVTLEPCAMCAGAIVGSRLDRASLHHPEVTSGVRAEESQTLLREFFAAKR